MLILDEGTVDHNCYIKNVLSAALKYGNEVFVDKCIFQQDGAKLHGDHLTEEWCRDNFPSLIDKDRGASKQSILDDSIWNESIKVIDWNKARSKMGVTDSTIKIVDVKSVVVESWANRLYRMSQND